MLSLFELLPRVSTHSQDNAHFTYVFAIYWGSDATVITSVVAAPQHYSLQPAGRPHAADAAGQQPRVHRRQRAGTGGPGWRPLRLLAPPTAPAHPSGFAAPWPRGP